MVVMDRYIRWLYKLMGEQPFVLIMDVHKSHNVITNFAEANGIQIIKVPANGTGTYQPLDRKVFGVLKSRLCKKESYLSVEKEAEGHPHTYKYKIMHERTIFVWEHLDPHLIKSAWEIPGL